MTQIVVTLENGADSNLLRRAIENMKGVIKAKIQRDGSAPSSDETADWIRNMKALSQKVDPSIIDLNDERTKYIMSK
jgi:hypothetical protein